jgi:hypothetical protein
VTKLFKKQIKGKGRAETSELMARIKFFLWKNKLRRLLVPEGISCPLISFFRTDMMYYIILRN